MLAGTAIVIVRTIAGAFAARNASRPEMARLREQIEQQAAALDDAHAALAEQADQLTALEERVDFAERLLAQNRERPGIGPGEKQS
jgi:hypothetical protein